MRVMKRGPWMIIDVEDEDDNADDADNEDRDEITW